MIDFKEKNIVLFGNARSVFNEEREIDNKYDIICRINAGNPIGKENYLGSKTDVLFLSLNLSEYEIELFESKYIVLCSPKIFLNYDYDDVYDINNWSKLFSKLGSRPSTGIMAFDYILKIGGFKTLTLIGFDFWETPNWITNTVHIAKHSPKAEKKYIEQKIKEYNGKIVMEQKYGK